MAPTPREMLLVKTPRQRAVLTSPLRMELLEQFDANKRTSVAEAAARMGRRPGALYYHVDLLVKAGILVADGSRRAGKRTETLYRPAAKAVAVPCDPAVPATVESAVRAVASAFRLAEREIQSAISRRAIVPQGPERNFFTRRIPVRLRPAALRRINRHIDAIVAIAMREHSRADGPGDDDTPYSSITIAMAPMNRGPTATKSTFRSRSACERSATS